MISEASALEMGDTRHHHVPPCDITLVLWVRLQVEAWPAQGGRLPVPEEKGKDEAQGLRPTSRASLWWPRSLLFSISACPNCKVTGSGVGGQGLHTRIHVFQVLL